jgi:anti-anti-sigma regulatory factor
MIHLQCEPGGEDTAPGGILKIAGEATVDHAQELKEALQQALEEHDQLQLDCTGIETLDFFAIQLLCSAHRTAVARKKRLGFVGTAPPPVEEALARAGFVRHQGCSYCPEGDRCLWIAPDA